jgi:hypothetical protein
MHRQIRRNLRRRATARIAVFALSLIAGAAVAATSSRSYGAATHGEASDPFAELTATARTRLTFSDDLDRSTTTPPTIDASDDAVDPATGEPTHERVNPVPLTPQLGAATLTLVGLLIARYRRNLAQWLA